MNLRPELTATAVMAAVVGVQRLSHRWGSTAMEHAEELPGDDLVPAPAIVATRAVTIDASAEEIWRWLVQIGQNRGGMYSYDWIENVLGLRIHSAERVDDEWQHLAVGDRIVLVPPGWAGLPDGYSLPVVAVDPPRTLVLRQSPPEHPWNAVWSFHIHDLDATRCRLISRGRSRRREGLAGIADLALDIVMDPVSWIMTRKMLLGIKARAERHTSIPAAS